ncbi:MAG: divalent-cation tolerance protein CutA [bacterium]|nr:divalent-cation tolerance protein CutA [bacterium]
MRFVFVTIDSLENAKKLVSEVVKLKLAACGNIVKVEESIYWWKGKVESAREYLIILKTTKDKYTKLESKIKQLHPYQVPEVVLVNVEKVYKKYFKWVEESIS